MKKALGIALQILAIVVWVQFIATQLYDPQLEAAGLAIWRVLDPIMVLGALVAVWVAFDRKRRHDSSAGTGLTRDYFEANVTLYGGIALFHALLWNWIGFQFSDPVATHQWLWALIDISLPLLLAPTGRYLIVSSELGPENRTTSQGV